MTLRKFNRPIVANNGIDRFFNDFFYLPNATSNDSKNTFRSQVPAVNITEEDENFIISVAAPGMKKADFSIEINDGTMSISGELSAKAEEETEKFTRREFNFSSFERRFTLPENIKEDKVKASYKDGILNVEIPKETSKEIKDKKKLISIS
jgi:HSP20 family protein